MARPAVVARYDCRVLRRFDKPSPLLGIIIGVAIGMAVLLCVVLAIVGWWMFFRVAPRHDWAIGPITPGHYPTTVATQTATAPPAIPTSPQMLLGNPSNATEDSSNRDNYLMLKLYFALAYNDAAGTPRWVSWRLCAADLGDAPRKRKFDTDESLPAIFNRITMRDYAGSGFDRGHMCDHSDRAATMDSSYATFVMTNIVPQAPNNNRKCWAQLENYCRELARSGDRLYITSGPVGRGGIGDHGPADTIADGRVVVPHETWKVIVVTPDLGADALSNVDSSDRVIAVDVPNDNDQCGEEWDGFRCSPASIEVKTGLRFFGALPDGVRTQFDGEVDRKAIAAPVPLVHVTH